MGIIVNADDFGISNEVNEAIDLAFLKGKVNRTTLMVNMPFAVAAFDMAKEKGYDHKVGIHLNLTEGKPLTEAIRKDGIMCDENGFFTGDFVRNFKTRFFVPKKTAEHINLELRAQLEEYKRLGGSLWHIDSHHYVHTNYSVWRELKKIMRDYPITSVRLSRNMYLGGNVFKRIYKLFLNASIRSFCKTKEDLFGSMEDYEAYMEGLTKEEINLFSESKQIEIMVHPMFDQDGELTLRN